MKGAARDCRERLASMTASAASLALTLTPTQRRTAEGRNDQPAPVKTGRSALAESTGRFAA